jgi:hypothetical protein
MMIKTWGGETFETAPKKTHSLRNDSLTLSLRSAPPGVTIENTLHFGHWHMCR